jgi:hypothetical protein
MRILGIVLIVAGVLGLAYGSFTYISDTHEVDLGLFEVKVVDRDTVNVPVWAGVVAIGVGAGLLFFRKGDRG